MPQYLANEKHLGFQTTASYLSVWMFCAIFAYYLCGWLSDLFGRRYVIPAFCLPAAILLAVMGQLDGSSSLFWVGLILNFLITGSYGSGLGYNTELFPTQIRGTAVGTAFTFGSAGGALAPAIVGWIATSHSIATALPLLALSFFLIVPMFLFVARETTRLRWLCVVLLVTAGRCTLWLRYRGAESRVVDFTQWSWGATCGSLLGGMCWGLGGMALFPIAPIPGQIFLIFVIGGMCTGAVVMSASHLSSLLAFLLSASLPMAVLLFRQGTTTAIASGAMILIFAAALSAAGLHLSRFFARTIQLRFDLEAANLRLQAEMAEREVTEAALHQAQKLEAIGRLTGGIAHDFNNLLTVVIGDLGLAIGRAGNMPSILPRLESALHAAERGATLIERLLAFARKQRLDPRSVDVNHLVIGIEDLLRRTLGNRIRIAINAEADLAPARVDANQLELAILNLAINARDAMPDGGLLHIDLRNHVRDRNSPPELSPGEYVVVSISDTGTGMDEATLAHAIEPFFTTKEIGSGSGLGLSMVHGFAAQSRGAMRIQSKVGGGTTVELWLPRPPRRYPKRPENSVSCPRPPGVRRAIVRRAKLAAPVLRRAGCRASSLAADLTLSVVD